MSGAAIFFGDLWLLWVALPLFVVWTVVWLLLPRWRHWRGGANDAAVRYSSVRQVRRLRRTPAVVLRTVVGRLRWFSIALLLLAVLRPQTGRTLTQINTEGIDIVLVMDTSGSMQALDLDVDEGSIERRRNRLEVAKDVVADFVRARENDQIGVVVFGEQSYTQCPLTLDHGIVSTFLERLEIGMAGDATAIGSAVGTAIKRLQGSQAESKVVVLLTDGRNNAGALSPSTAAEVAETFGIKIYAIGVGTRGKAPFLVQTPLGPRVQYENVEIDEDTLQRMAEVSGGAFFRAEDDRALEQVYEEIDRLEKSELSMESYMEYDERFTWLVIPALALLLLEVGLLQTRLRKLP